MKQDYPLIKSSGGNEALWKTIVDHPHVASLSGAVDTHLTDTKTVSGDVIYAGDLLVLNDNNTVGLVTKDPDFITTPVLITSVQEGTPHLAVNDNIVIATWFVGSTGIYVRVGESVGDTVEWGSSVLAISAASDLSSEIHYDIISDRIVIHGRQFSGSYLGYATVGTLTTTGATSAHTVEFGPIIPLDNVHGTNNWRDSRFRYNEKDNTMMEAWRYFNGLSISRSYLTTCSVVATGAPSAATISFGTDLQITTGGVVWELAYDSFNDQEFIYSGTAYSTISTSGDTTTLNSSIKYVDIGAATYVNMYLGSNTNKCVIVYKNSTDLFGYSAILTKTPGNIDVSNIEKEDNMSTSNGMILSYDSVLDKYLWWNSPTGREMHTKTGTLYGDVLSWYKSQVGISYSAGTYYQDVIFLPSQGRFIVGYEDGLLSYSSTYYEIGLTNLTDDNFYGISQEVKSNGQDVLIGRFCYMDTNQSGLTINTNYYIDDYGGLTSKITQPLVGKAVSDTEIIIKG